MTHAIALADLSSAELDAFLALTGRVQPHGTRPRGAAAKRKLLRERTGSDQVGSLDINLADAEILQKCGIAADTAQAIMAAKPFFSMEELLRLGALGEADRTTLQRLFHVAPLRLPEGRELAPDTSSFVIPVAPKAEMRVRSATVAGGPSDIAYRYTTDGEAEDLARKGALVLPAFTDPAGVKRFLDPRFVAIQFDLPVDAPEVRDQLARSGVIPFRSFDTPGLIIAQLQDGQTGLGALNTAMALLSASPYVQFVEPAWIGLDDIEANGEARPAPKDLPWNLRMIGLNAGQGGSRQVTLAAVDTGVDATHPALAPAILPPQPGERRNFSEYGVEPPADDDGHGTAVASVLAGSGAGGIWGVAPGCGLICLRVPLRGSLSAYAARRDALLQLAARARGGERLVVNLSWKTDGDVALIRTAIADLAAAGALVVCSAGNGMAGLDAPHYPSDYPQAISVAALNIHGARAYYSFHGEGVDIAAPGGDAQGGILCASIGGGEVGRWGTSFAAPHVAAALALLWSQEPGLRAAEVRARIEAACVPLETAGMGRGRLSLDGILAGETEPAIPTQPPGPFPMPGAALAVASCALPRITQRILAGRPAVASWDEVSAILGVTPAHLDCLRQHV